MDSVRLKKAYYQSVHRGCKESDYVLTRFANNYLEQLDENLLCLYEQFLKEEDADIMAWVMGKSRVPDVYADLFNLINQLT